MSNSTTTHSTSRESRLSVHPLLLYDPDALNGGIQLIKLEYFEAETTRAPVPRNQEVPKDAFGILTGRSILVATSHAWFHQCHPDPHGVKLAILRKKFFPRLRERFPRTQILIFDDWHSCPQWPRTTQEENDRFRKCMDQMNSVYCYCDVVLFVDSPLPDLDNTVFSCDLVPSEHKWLYFIDTIQYLGGNNQQKVTIRKNDIVIKIKDIDGKLDVNTLKEMKDRTTIKYLKRPYGRPNRTPAEKRGWLYAERITVAIRMATAQPEMFHDVVTSNNPDLVRQIFAWSDELRTSARKEKTHPGSISKQLNRFRDVLATMKFTFPDNDKLVNDIITDLVKQFEENWKQETRRQMDMATRTREILLRWGCFSEDYVERAELLCDSKDVKHRRRSWVLLSIIVGVIPPMVGVLPFLVSLEKDGMDPARDQLFVSSVWLGFLIALIGVSAVHGLLLAFLKIPTGIHTVCEFVSSSCHDVLISIVCRTSSNMIIPFDMFLITAIAIILNAPLIKRIKWIPIQDTRTNQTKRWEIAQWFLPASHRFNLKMTADAKRVAKTFNFSSAFVFTYPIIGGLFFQSGIFIQALLIPVFFILRAGFEYGADDITSKTFGSDGMPAINFAGVLMHEICLSVMITSIKHPLVFVSLVLSDVLENSFCLWSLARNTTRNRVSPEHGEEQKEEASSAIKSLTRRSSNVVSLVMNKDDVSDKGTALFIAATLLQREVVETLVPVQAALILSVLYNVDVKSNSIVSGWSDEDWSQSMMYIGIDLGVEFIVFAGTLMALRRIYPEFNAWRILRGLLRTHWVEMTMLSIAVWTSNLLFQSTYSGMDMTMKFEWWGCKDEVNSTWLGGFDWEC